MYRIPRLAPPARRASALRSALAATFTVVLVITMGITGSRSAGAVTTQSDSCVDGGGVRWTAKAIWGQIYTAGDMTKVVIDYAGWTTSRAGTVPTDSSVRSYDGTGHLLHTMTRTEDFNYASGTAYRSRNPHNPPSAPGAAKVTVMLGVDGDGLKSCTITFTQPRTAATPPSPACNGRTVTPGMDVQAVVNDSAPGSIFCFAPGIYHIAITPKSGQVFDGGNQAAILDGQNNRQHAFRGASTSNVTVRGFVVRNYKTPLQQGAIHAFGTSGWTIAGNRITRNAATGVATDTGAKVLNNLIDHNGQQGYAAHGNNILYEGNEIAYNNENLAVDASWEAGGGKAWATAHAVFRNNNVHHNGGNGLWDDTNNIHITYDRNIVAHNWGAGIYHEIGYDATITNNVVTNNGTSSSQGGGQGNGWLWNAGIQLRSSGGLTSSSPILIRGNIVKNNYNGIALLDSPAAGCTNKELDEGAYGPCRLQNIRVEKNTITMNQGATGVVHDGSGDAVFTNRNVRFQDNTYYVPSSKHPDDGRTYGWFAWRNAWPDWAGWTASGNDTGGRFGR